MGERNMNISVNGQSQVPPGFRFHPTEEELLLYYLKKKVSNLRIDLDVIRDIDLNKLEPWDIQEKCRIGTTPQNDWYFFSHKDKKYPTGTRTNRATTAGFWKATGRDKAILSNSRRIGMRKTLVFYTGRAPHGQKSDWIMHEYRLEDNSLQKNSNSMIMIESTQEEGWVVCRIFKKKNHYKTHDDHHDIDDHHHGSPLISSATSTAEIAAAKNSDTISTSPIFDDQDSENDNQEGALEQIFRCMRSRSTNNINCKQETHENNNNNMMNIGFVSDERFSKLPRLESPNNNICNDNLLSFYHDDQMINNWTALDCLVSSQLNGQTTCFNNNSNNCDDLQALSHVAVRSSPSSLNNMMSKSNNANIYQTATLLGYMNDVDMWTFARSSSSSYSSSDLICHVVNRSL